MTALPPSASPAATPATEEEWAHARRGYMRGRCAHLALAVHRLTSLPLLEIESGRGNHVVCELGAVTPDGPSLGLDIMGVRPLEQIARDWVAGSGSGYVLLPVAETRHADLLEIYTDPRNDPTLDDELWAGRLIDTYLIGRLYADRQRQPPRAN